MLTILIQIVLIHIFLLYYYNYHFNIIIPSTLTTPNSSPSFMISDQNFVRSSLISLRGTCPVQLILGYSKSERRGRVVNTPA
jgi:hypothetical protein